MIVTALNDLQTNISTIMRKPYYTKYGVPMDGKGSNVVEKHQ